MVLGLCIDSNGIPIDYELYPGNTSEFGTMCPMIESIRRHYCIKKMVVVADRGLNSNENLKSLLDMGCDFVIAQKIRNCPQEIQKQIFDVSRWQTTQVDMATGEITLRHLNLELSREIRETCMSAKGNRYTRSTGQFMDVNWLVTFSSSRQQKELRDIDRMVEKAEKAIAGGQLSVSSKGYRSLISIPKGKGEPRLNEEKIQEKRKWAGYYCICTNMATDSPLEIINTYRQLWQIEDCFRTSKSFLEARPCFVWTENHIRGHFVSCFISLVFEQLLKYKLKVEDQLSLSTQEILKALRDAEVVCMNDDPLNPLYIKLEMPEHFESIGKAFDLEVLHSVEDRSGLRKKLHLKQIRS